MRKHLYLFTLLLCVQPLLAQDLSRRSVRVHGESQVSAEPDQAEMDIGVVTLGATIDVASAQNTQRVNAVTQSLRTLLPAANIKTVNLSINPNYRYAKQDAPPAIDGYMINNTIRVSLDDISILRKVIDTAIKSGATSLNRLNFTLNDESEKRVRAQALGQAARQAEANATALANSLKLQLGQVILVEEGQPVVVSPAPQIDLGKAQSSDLLPLSPGLIQIRANVNVVYEVLSVRHK